MTRSTENPWLARFAVLTAGATLALIGVGGLVTSHGAGMAVPDWPTSYGYNMFLLPISYWVGGILYEHSHRLVASGVGFLTTILAVWLWLKESRAWLRWLGVTAFVLVVVQGLLGGLRVVLYQDELGIFHAAIAQLFFLLVCAIALFTSGWWRRMAGRRRAPVPRWLPSLLLGTTLLVFVQLVVGAIMRHQHAGLAIPDFPLAYGRLWPATDAAALETINQTRVDARDFRPVTAFQVHLHLAHRICAALIVLAVGLCAGTLRKQLGRADDLSRFSLVWAGLILAQALLGAMTVWSNKAADIATLHVVIGALNLSVGGVLTLVALRRSQVPVSLENRMPRNSVTFPADGSPAAASPI